MALNAYFPSCLEHLIQEYVSWEYFIQGRQKHMLRLFQKHGTWPFAEIMQYREHYLGNKAFLAFWLHHWLPWTLQQVLGSYAYHLMLMPRSSNFKRPRFDHWLHNTPYHILNHNVPALVDFEQWVSDGMRTFETRVTFILRFIDREAASSLMFDWQRLVKTWSPLVDRVGFSYEAKYYNIYLSILPKAPEKKGWLTDLISIGKQDAYLR